MSDKEVIAAESETLVTTALKALVLEPPPTPAPAPAPSGPALTVTDILSKHETQLGKPHTLRETVLMRMLSTLRKELATTHEQFDANLASMSKLLREQSTKLAELELALQVEIDRMHAVVDYVAADERGKLIDFTPLLRGV